MNITCKLLSRLRDDKREVKGIKERGKRHQPGRRLSTLQYIEVKEEVRKG